MAKKQTTNKKWVLWIVILVIFVSAAVAAYLIGVNFFENKNDNKQEQHTEKIEEKKKIETTTKNVEQKDDSEDKPKVIQYDGDDPNKAENLSGVITYAGVNNGVLIVRVNIDQFVEGGACNLTLTSNGKVVFGASTEIVENASTATCEGFDIPIEGLERGLMKITIDLEANGKSGLLTSEVEI